MRVRLPFGRTLFFLGAFFLAMIALLPMRLALEWFGIGQRGVAAREVQGSVWYGALKEAQLGTAGLGDLQAGLRALPLVLGERGCRSTARRARRPASSAGRRR
jgi:general secretion pathway protein N